jgi:hypothetical protein
MNGFTLPEEFRLCASPHRGLSAEPFPSCHLPELAAKAIVREQKTGESLYGLCKMELGRDKFIRELHVFLKDG